ncbi:MAG: acetyl-CoA carboxylase biotin carboxylase subunit [Victivallales bacterium]|nr:acetyl-CoA carboxylase biotin carboxylase subunit [Victivallales bacterium]
MFKRILIANRGEIALRIIRACREMGIETVAVYSKADETSLHVEMADHAVCIGPPQSNLSYLVIDQIISAAEICDVDAIHPGYGFLAENAHFAEVCDSCNIKFIGPSPEQINSLGDKSCARETMLAAGVPITPGSDGEIDDEETAIKVAEELGYPVMIKASAGGGGKGMREARNQASLVQGFHAASNEAEMAFGNGAVYLEKLIEDPRHIEFQILADEHGHCVHLGERDCSIQRRHQKLIEESPSPAITRSLRRRMGAAAVKAAKAANYTNAGTIEFLLSSTGEFYFMEMNTRIQVEHPVTEEMSGIDLIKEQIKIANGEKLSFTQKDIKLDGHAIECRVNAENPFNDFSPCPGKVDVFNPPGGMGTRVDSHVYSGYTISPYYDSMIAKLIVHAPDRAQAIAKMERALDEFLIHGVQTSIPFSKFLVSSADFKKGTYDTGYIERIMNKGLFEDANSKATK